MLPNYPLAVIREWTRGCTCASPDNPGECKECTEGAFNAIRTWFEQAEKEAVTLEGDAFQAWFLTQARQGLEKIRDIEELERLLAEREAARGK